MILKRVGKGVEGGWSEDRGVGGGGGVRTRGRGEEGSVNVVRVE